MKLSAREKRFVAAALVSAALFAVLEFGVLPEREEWAGGAEELLRLQKQLRHRRELAAAAAELQNQAAALQARLQAEEGRLLAATEVNQAGAELEQWISQRAAEHQLEVVRSDFLPAEALGESYVRVPVRLELSGRITSLVQFFTALLQGERRVALEEVQINMFGVSNEKRVRCMVVVAGLMKNPT